MGRKLDPDAVAIAGGFASLFAAGALAVAMAVSSAGADHWTRHSLQVRQTDGELLNAIEDAETGQRGYLLTGDRSYLAPFASAGSQIEPILRRLKGLVRDNPGQQQRLAQLKPLIAAKLAVVRRTIELRDHGRPAEALAIVETNNGSALMRRIRLQLSDFDQAELRLQQQRAARAAMFRSVLLVVTLAALAASCGLGLLVLRAGRRYATELRAQNRALRAEIGHRERTEARLRQAQKMDALGQLTGGVAHDFNNMLAIIIGNLDLARRRLPEDLVRVDALLANAHEGASRAGVLTKQLLAFSRQQALDPKPTDINEVIRSVSEMLRRTLGDQIEIEAVIAGGLWRALVDRTQLESALINLAVNGRDAMPEGGRLTIETANAYLDSDYVRSHPDVVAGQYVLIAVTDNGAGMSREILDKAFDPFFTTKPHGAGTGLGLSQVHGFLKQSRGHVKLYSEPGVGTTVKLYLPRDLSGADVIEPSADRPRALDRSATVLVVEDNPAVRAFAVSAVRELGLSALEADGAAVALQLVRQHPEIAMLLTDVVMPGVSGRRLVEQALELRPDLKVVYMTGYTANAIVHNGVLDPGTRLLTKPFTVDQLERELSEILRPEAA